VAAPRASLDPWRLHDSLIRDVRRISESRGGGPYPGADTSPLPRVTWSVPADKCRALHAEYGEDDMWRRARPTNDEIARLHRLVFAPDVETTPHALARALHAAPLTSALAAALWSRCPRDDGRMWRLTDTLSDDDAARLEGASGKCDFCRGTGVFRAEGLYTGPYQEGDRCREHGCDGGWLFLDHRGLAVTRGIPLANGANGALARLAPGQGGRMLALVEVECPTCESLRRRMPFRGVEFMDGVAPSCTHCAGTGRRPLVDVASEGSSET